MSKARKESLVSYMRKQAKLEGDRVVFKETAYAESLPKGLTMETVQQVEEHNNQFIAAAATVFGEESINALNATESLDVTCGTVQMSKAILDLGFYRTATVDTVNGMETRQNHLTAQYIGYNDLTEVKEHLRSLSSTVANVDENAELSD